MASNNKRSKTFVSILLETLMLGFYITSFFGLIEMLARIARADDLKSIELKEISLDYRLYFNNTGTPIDLNYNLNIPPSLLWSGANQNFNLNLPQLQYNFSMVLNAKLNLFKYGYLDNSLGITGAQVLNEGIDQYGIPLASENVTLGIHVTKWLDLYGNYGFYLVGNNVISNFFPLQSSLGAKIIFYKNSDDKNYLIKW